MNDEIISLPENARVCDECDANLEPIEQTCYLVTLFLSFDILSYFMGSES